MSLGGVADWPFPRRAVVAQKPKRSRGMKSYIYTRTEKQRCMHGTCQIWKSRWSGQDDPA